MQHNVYGLLECPPLPQAVYLLVRRQANGSLKVLYIASALSDAPTLNLARIRQRGATLGANEVHAAPSCHQCRGVPHHRLRLARGSVRQFGRAAFKPGQHRLGDKDLHLPLHLVSRLRRTGAACGSPHGARQRACRVDLR